MLGLLYRENRAPIQRLFERAKSKSEAVATFLAVLELLKNERIALDDGGVLTMASPSAGAPPAGEDIEAAAAQLDTGFYDRPSEDGDDGGGDDDMIPPDDGGEEA